MEEFHDNVLAWRDVPTDNKSIGPSALASEPKIIQLFVAPKTKLEPTALETELMILRRLFEREIRGIGEVARAAAALPRTRRPIAAGAGARTSDARRRLGRGPADSARWRSRQPAMLHVLRPAAPASAPPARPPAQGQWFRTRRVGQRSMHTHTQAGNGVDCKFA